MLVKALKRKKSEVYGWKEGCVSISRRRREDVIRRGVGARAV